MRTKDGYEAAISVAYLFAIAECNTQAKTYLSDRHISSHSSKDSFVVAGTFSTRMEVESYKTYIFTKVVWFLLLLTVTSQDVTRSNFQFVPDLGKYEGVYTDELLCKRWGITKEEWNFIDAKIKAIGGPVNSGDDE